MVDAVRITQNAVEAVVNIIPDDQVRVTHQVVEAIVAFDTVDRVRVTQNFVEAIVDISGSPPASANPVRAETTNVNIAF